MRNRIIAIVLIIALIPCCLAVPASATSIETSRSMVDLFVTSGFDTYIDLKLLQSNSLETNINAYGLYYGFRWECANNFNIGYLVISVRSSSQPSRVVVTLDGSDNRIFYSDTPSSINGYFYQYKIAIDANTFSLIDVSVNYNKVDSRDVTLTSCVGYADYSKHVSSVYYDFFCDFINLSDGIITHDVITAGVLGSFPFACDVTHDEGLNGDKLVGGQVDLYFLADSLGYTHADKLSLLMYASGASFSCGAILKDKLSGLSNAVLETNYTFSPTGSYYHSYYGTDVPLGWYLIDIDLSGYDLTENSVVFSVWVDEYDYSNITRPVHGVSIGMIGAAVTPHIEQLPWYTILFNWFGKQFNSIGSWFQVQTNAISTWGQNVVNSVTTSGQKIYDVLAEPIFNKISSILTAVNTWGQNTVNSIITWGQNIVNVINPDPDAGESAKDKGSEKGEIINGLNDQMNNLSKPDVSGSGDISSIISPKDLTSYTTFLSTVVNAPYISQVVMLSLILSLAAYVLFGKR